MQAIYLPPQTNLFLPLYWFWWVEGIENKGPFGSVDPTWEPLVCCPKNESPWPPKGPVCHQKGGLKKSQHIPPSQAPFVLSTLCGAATKVSLRLRCEYCKLSADIP